jgi:hypothetical protein
MPSGVRDLSFFPRADRQSSPGSAAAAANLVQVHESGNASIAWSHWRQYSARRPFRRISSGNSWLFASPSVFTVVLPEKQPRMPALPDQMVACSGRFSRAQRAICQNTQPIKTTAVAPGTRPANQVHSRALPDAAITRRAKNVWGP